MIQFWPIKNQWEKEVSCFVGVPSGEFFLTSDKQKETNKESFIIPSCLPILPSVLVKLYEDVVLVSTAATLGP